MEFNMQWNGPTNLVQKKFIKAASEPSKEWAN